MKESKPLSAARPSPLNPAASRADPMIMQPRTRIWAAVAAVALLCAGCGLLRPDPDADQRDRIQDQAEEFLEELDLGDGFTKDPITAKPATTPQERFGPSSGSVTMSFTSTDALTAAEFSDRILPILRDAGLELIATAPAEGPICREDFVSVEWYSPRIQLTGRIAFEPARGAGGMSFLSWYQPLPLDDISAARRVDESDMVCPRQDP